MSYWMRTPELVTLPLTADRWLLVHKHLTAGQQRRMMRLMLDPSYKGMELRADPLKAQSAQAAVYLVDWNLTNDHEDVIPIRDQDELFIMAALDNLTAEGCADVFAAVAAHDAAQSAAREAEKKNGALWRTEVVTDLAIARICHWRYEWVSELDRDVYAILVAELSKEGDR